MTAQTDAERTLRELGTQALEAAIAAGKPAILLAGHSYNAFTPEASQSVGKKLSSMGIAAIPADCLLPVGEGPTSWHFANQVLNAVAIAKQYPRYSCSASATSAAPSTRLPTPCSRPSWDQNPI